MRIGRASSLEAARTTWDSAVASSALASVTGSPVASVSRGNSSAGRTRRLNSERPGGDAGLLVGDLDLDAAGGQRPDDVGGEPARQDDDAVAAPRDGDLARRW